MNAVLGCQNGDVYAVKDFNVVRMQSFCPVCGSVSGLAEALGIIHGDKVARIASDQLSALNRASERSGRDLAPLIEQTSAVIERAIKEFGR